MSFKIGTDGIDSIKFTISLDENSATVLMTQPYKNKSKFYEERDRIGNIFRATFSHLIQ